MNKFTILNDLSKDVSSSPCQDRSESEHLHWKWMKLKELKKKKKKERKTNFLELQKKH